jgi:hypothetical protein
MSLKLVTISYDIACQWSKKFWDQMEHMPSWLQLPASMKLCFRVSKFHLPAHGQKCWAPFSLNFTNGIRWTDAKGVKCNWAWLNGIARCVSMMGPGGCWDMLDDFCGFHNWRKTVALGEFRYLLRYHWSHLILGDQLLWKLTLVLPQVVVHHRAYCAFTDSMHTEQPALLEEWEERLS